jgi:hypothetical protein
MISKEEMEAARKQKEAADATITAYFKQEQESFDERWEKFSKGGPDSAFKAEELVFSAEARCRCKAGLAHPNKCGPRHQWTCSRVLLGQPDEAGFEGKHESYSFMMYSIKSEGQPSAQGATMRPQ